MFLSHGTTHCTRVSILLHPTMQNRAEYSFSNKSRRTVLITIDLKALKLSLCNIYAPNSQTEQLEFLQDLNNCLMDKSEISNLVFGGDSNCTLSKKNKIGGSIWRPTI